MKPAIAFAAGLIVAGIAGLAATYVLLRSELQPESTETQLTKCKDQARALFAEMMPALVAEIDKQAAPKPAPIREGADEVERARIERLNKVGANMTNFTKGLIPVIGPAIMEQKLATMEGDAGLAECQEYVAQGRKNMEEFVAKQINGNGAADK
ncbi:MAG: hypothetical protein J2P50_10540 [Hyphomicrobiaceae bacterium]|nr:hypothetical protein [Hyphomicrobiaceae bacterium]